jgi:sulfonate dioxygenase
MFLTNFNLQVSLTISIEGDNQIVLVIGTSFFWILDQPPSGGDTVFVNMVEAYKRLSPAFKQRLIGLEAIHSGVEQAEFSRSGKRGGVVRREPVEHAHPVVGQVQPIR